MSEQPFNDEMDAMEWLGVPGQSQQSIYRDGTVDPEALRDVILAIANKLKALEDKISNV